MIFLLPFFAISLAIACCGYMLSSEKHVRRLALISGVSGGLIAFATAILSLAGIISLPVNGVWHTDAFTWFLVSLISLCYMSATIVSYRYLGVEYHEGTLSLSQVRLYFLLLPLFILSMLVAVFSDNLGILWMGLESTTLATTMLVALYRKDASIEAAWKYIILCSIGISLGLLGMLLFVYAAVHGTGLSPVEALSLANLRDHATAFDPVAIRWAFIFVFIGLGTKVGFVPMHTWLPDAHSKTPSPISALLSGVLLNVALYAILRFKTVTDLALDGANWSEHLFLVFGTISVVVAALFLLQQRNYKRMLAYSSIEHMGLMAFAIGLGPIGLIAALLHTIAHSLTKSMLFFGAGEILLHYKTTKIEGVRDVMKHLPITGSLFLCGLLLILAVPPSGLFTSEFLIGMAGLQLYPWLTLLLLVALSLIAFSMLRSVTTMWYAQGTEETSAETAIKENWNLTHAVMLAHLLLALSIGYLATTTSGFAILGTIAQSL